jgi:hypothetical protein
MQVHLKEGEAYKMRTFVSVLFASVLNLVTAMPVIASTIIGIAITPVTDTVWAAIDYSITFTQATGESKIVVIDFATFGTTETNIVLNRVLATIGGTSGIANFPPN